MPSTPALLIACLLDATLEPGSPPSEVHAEAPARQRSLPSEIQPESPRRAVLPVLAALVPGLIVHGSGHFVAGDSRSAGRLLAAQGVSLALTLVGVAGLGLTGASAKTVVPLIWLTGAGVGAMATSALADLYGVAAPRGGWGRAGIEPSTDVDLGALYVRNPTFPYRWVAGAALDTWVGRLQLSPILHWSLDGQTRRAELRAGYRLLGAAPRDRTPAVSTLDVSLGVVHHREGRDAPFDMTMGEVLALGRLGLEAFLPSLAGAFFEGAAGLAGGLHHYGAPISAIEARQALLMRFGFGFFLGGFAEPGTATRGELLLVYDHRHDGFAGGMKVIGLGSGAGGHVGVEGFFFPGPRWGVGGRVQLGSAHVFGLSVRWRPAGAPR